MSEVMLRRVARQAVVILVACLATTMAPLSGVVKDGCVVCAAEAAQAGEEPWKQEFDDVCRKTTDSMSLSQEELKSLVDRCDKLKPAIDKLEETPRKVYSYKLEMCRKLFVFMLESKK